MSYGPVAHINVEQRLRIVLNQKEGTYTHVTISNCDQLSNDDFTMKNFEGIEAIHIILCSCSSF